MKSFAEMVGAMGLTKPSDLRPYHVMRRVSVESVKLLSEVHDYLKPGVLLGSTIPTDYKTFWELADADAF